ncbi:MAG: sel1 repeat family protein [Alphaproteobacteria bacterium]|nr:sel1 repeat family protein [Alphaproteobacteria bacterium]
MDTSVEKYKKGIILFTLSLLMAILIIYSFSSNENSTQFKTIYKAAITGDAKSQNQLGLIYEKGLDDIAIDKEEAVKWYQRAAEQGFPEALDNLGNCFYQGIGVSLNYKEAVKWYTKAAEQGYNISQNRLGNCYFHGKGVEKIIKQHLNGTPKLQIKEMSMHWII